MMLSILVPLLLPVLLALASPNQESIAKAKSINLTDRLSEDPDFTLLLRLLQRARLIPTLNRLEDATLFAPTNDAIERYINTSHIYARALFDTEPNVNGPRDNVQHELRQHLFYHLLNFSIPILPKDFPTQKPLIFETLHYPDLPVQHPSPEPPPSPPWLPEPGGLLDRAPQRLRAVFRDSKPWIAVDSMRRGGVEVAKEPINASNGIIIPLRNVIPLPGNLYQEVKAHPLISEFASILSPETIQTLSTSPHITLFFPVDSAWSVLDDIERKYLHSGYAEHDVGKLVAMHSSGSGINGSGGVGWSDTWDEGRSFTTVDGEELKIGYSADGTVQIGQSTVVQDDIYAANGVLHIISSLLVKPDTFQINAEKYLLTLNATSFVSLLRTANLSHYVDDEHDAENWTILAPRDDDMIWSNPPENLSKVLKYHFIPGKTLPGELVDGSLLGSELREKGLQGGRQRIPVSVSSKGGTVSKDANGEVSFSDARVVSTPVEAPSFIIYIVSHLLEPPPSAIARIESDAQLSTYLAAAFSTGLIEIIKETPSTTILTPYNRAFEKLGLLTSYLLLPEQDSRKALCAVLKHHILTSVAYSTDIGDKRSFNTLEGTSVTINGTSVIGSGSWNVTGKLHPSDTLTKSGVIHAVEDILLPSRLRVTIGDLALAAGCHTMIELIHRAGLGKVLNGTLTMKDVDDLDDWERRHRRKDNSNLAPISGDSSPMGWTLLCPPDSGFNRVNLSRLYDDKDALQTLVLQHIIPTPATPNDLSYAEPISFGNDATFTTLLSPSTYYGDLVMRETTSIVVEATTPMLPLLGDTPKSDSPQRERAILVGIKGARGTSGETDYARVISYGRTTTPDISGTRSGVVKIDRVLEPWVPGWWRVWGWAIPMCAMGSLGIIAFWSTVVYFFRKGENEATYEPLDTGDAEDI
ncbi:uncharacterized protein EI90DRAFT_2991353 [Cantharellus anzutake]|uniref:uncharacterized protein n=1 Tax=Cantharellus anzutake TaxID=1750568 RepID=UPI001903AFEA|nr:uncharacterized protein EI90DRAFT_2991353 [Cantharellus anzutake]KAF8338034.1 hypothetical protein EI90DRAFT_2991353 [Cantharellus anzutake]